MQGNISFFPEVRFISTVSSLTFIHYSAYSVSDFPYYILSFVLKQFSIAFLTFRFQATAKYVAQYNIY